MFPFIPCSASLGLCCFSAVWVSCTFTFLYRKVIVGCLGFFASTYRTDGHRKVEANVLRPLIPDERILADSTSSRLSKATEGDRDQRLIEEDRAVGEETSWEDLGVAPCRRLGTGFFLVKGEARPRGFPVVRTEAAGWEATGCLAAWVNLWGIPWVVSRKQSLVTVRRRVHPAGRGRAEDLVRPVDLTRTVDPARTVDLARTGTMGRAAAAKVIVLNRRIVTDQVVDPNRILADKITRPNQRAMTAKGRRLRHPATATGMGF